MPNTINELLAPRGFVQRKPRQRRVYLPKLTQGFATFGNEPGLTVEVIGTFMGYAGWDPTPREMQALVVTIDGVSYPCYRLEPTYAICSLSEWMPRKAA